MDTATEGFAEASMLIRKPVDTVYEAFVNPEVTTKIWFTKSSGRLDENKEVTWTWEMYNHTVPVRVKSLEKNSKILIEWGNYEQMSEVEWTFKDMKKQGTYVKVVNRGFKGDANGLLKQVRDSTEGFTLVLAGMKAYLEHGVQLGLVGDKFPKEDNSE